jgi:hypothetical protein
MMSENLYEPSTPPLAEAELISAREPFRWWYIPASICFMYGRVGAVIGLLVLIAPPVASEATVTNVLRSGLAFEMVLWAAWS